jgi:hypothetical protein
MQAWGQQGAWIPNLANMGGFVTFREPSLLYLRRLYDAVRKQRRQPRQLLQRG